MIRAVAAQQVRALRRQRTFVALLALFVAMSALAGLLGWSSTRTISRVYAQAAILLQSEGKPVPPNPIGSKPPLALLSNLTIYVPLVGALLALVLGHLSLADDRAGGLGRLLFSRQLSRRDYVLGKAAGAGALLAGAVGASLAVSVLSLAVANGSLPTPADLGRLVVFSGLCLLYLLAFAVVGMLTVLLVRRRSLALLTAMGVWLVVTFAVPQFTSGLRPTASLNPVTQPASTSTAFFRATAYARPLSLSEQFKQLSADVLQTGAAEPAATAAARAVPLAGALVLALAATAAAVRRRDWSAGVTGE